MPNHTAPRASAGGQIAAIRWPASGQADLSIAPSERLRRELDEIVAGVGDEPVTVKTTAGPLELERPRVRNASALGFASAIVGKGVARTHALEALVVCSFLRGLSVRRRSRARGRRCRLERT